MLPRVVFATIVLLLGQTFSPPTVALFERRFDLAADSETIATVHARCERCDWRLEGREAAQLIVWIDGRYSQHLTLARGSQASEYSILLGRLSRGGHQLRITVDRERSARDIDRPQIEAVDLRSVGRGSAEELGVSMAPILHARPNTIGRFTDLPLLMWYEIVPTARGRQFRYSVIFSNEDGGTPTDRLMATWGRTTDIEYVYGVEVDAGDRTLGEEYQGPEHKILADRGRHEARHPLLWVATDNNMVEDEGATEIRYAPAPTLFDLALTSREVVMDANPWTYRVMIDELVREGKVASDVAPGSGKIPEPRRFVFVEACADVENAAVSFGVRRDGDPRWYDSDRGLAEFRIVRTGCFRGAIPVSSADSFSAIRFRAHAKPAKEGEKPGPPGRVRLTRVNTVFLLRDDYTPGPSLFAWTGNQDLPVDGPEFIMPLQR